jgi:hypothetical protein
VPGEAQDPGARVDAAHGLQLGQGLAQRVQGWAQQRLEALAQEDGFQGAAVRREPGGAPGSSLLAQATEHFGVGGHRGASKVAGHI